MIKAHLLFTIFVLFLTPQVASSQIFQWIGPTNSLFRTSAAWSPLGPPGINDRAIFDLAGPYNVNFDQNEAPDTLFVTNENARYRPTGLLPVNHTYSLSAHRTIYDGDPTLAENVERMFQLDFDDLLRVGIVGASTLVIQNDAVETVFNTWRY